MTTIRNYINLIESYETETTYPFTWNEKTILWTNGNFYIASGNSENTYLTLWTDDNKHIGTLSSTLITHRNKQTDKLEKRKKIDSVIIDKKYQGQSLGKQFYIELLKWSSDDIVGIYSYLPQRSNYKQVPNIYQRMNGYIVDGDHAYIDR